MTDAQRWELQRERERQLAVAIGHQNFPLVQALDAALALGDWRNAALRVGEELAKDGPHGYYTFTATEWRQWAMFVLGPSTAGLPEWASAAKRVLELELENAVLDAAVKASGERVRELEREVEAKEQQCVLLDAKLLECAKEYAAAEAARITDHPYLRGLAEWQEKSKGD